MGQTQVGVLSESWCLRYCRRLSSASLFFGFRHSQVGSRQQSSSVRDICLSVSRLVGGPCWKTFRVTKTNGTESLDLLPPTHVEVDAAETVWRRPQFEPCNMNINVHCESPGKQRNHLSSISWRVNERTSGVIRSNRTGRQRDEETRNIYMNRYYTTGQQDRSRYLGINKHVNELKLAGDDNQDQTSDL